MATKYMQGKEIRDDAPPEMVQLPQRDAATARERAAAPVAEKETAAAETRDEPDTPATDQPVESAAPKKAKRVKVAAGKPKPPAPKTTTRAKKSR